MDDKTGIPEEAPDWLISKDGGKLLYEQLAVALNEIGFVRWIHQNALVTYCESWERERLLQEQIIEEGSVIVNKERKTKYLHPALNAQKMAQNEMARQAKILGMEVSQLESLGVVHKKNEADKDDPNDANSYLPS